ncbi:MarR family transcriptional regulator [Halobacteriales archaeon QH_8_64_26]|jgi:DNA-binding transcriptional ArsR family regulator|nr:MAG: MarR family transcriptional regulator [Halobacteriales archaeon QH_8_64_26]
MRAKREYRNRDETELAVLDALVDAGEDGLTVFELRSQADVGIDEIEEALPDLKEEGLIEVDRDDERMVIKPDEKVVPDPDRDEDDEFSLGDRVRYVIDRFRP